MKHFHKWALLGMLVLLAAAAAKADETVVTFDDLPATLGPLLVPSPYGGIDWNGNWQYFGETMDDPYNPYSAPNRVFDADSATPGVGDTFNFITPQVFDGAYFSGYSTATVTFELFNGSTLVGTSATLDPSSTPTFLASGYSGLVTQVEVYSPGPDDFVMDNVTYGTPGTSVPEPSSISLLLLGTGLLGFLRIFRGNANMNS